MNANGCDIGSAWTLVTGPTAEPISLDEAKQHARITDDNSNLVVLSYITTAREAAEAYMGRGILTQTWKLLLDGFANTMPLPMAAPLQSITSVKYYDTAGVQQTLATSVYDLDPVSRPGAVVLKVGQTWPSTQSGRINGVVEIVYVVGWTSAVAVPERIKQGLKQYVAYLDLDRDGMEERALEAMQAAERCWSDRIYWTSPQWGA